MTEAIDVPLESVWPEERLRRGPEAERRQLTVLFSDLVSSTEIAGRMDPEEWREVAAQYQRAVADAIARFGGHVAKFLGDGVVAYFGWPTAQDDAPERAVRAGLAIRDALARLNEHLEVTHRVRLAARVGIDTGMVVVGEGGSPEAEVFGDAPNVAARVQALAEPDTVVITSATHRLVAGLFVAEQRGAHRLKGVQEPIVLFRVVQPSGVRGRLRAGAARGLTPFVGRGHERQLLIDRFERAREGDGQVVLILGEAGIGKSRLLQQLREDLAGAPHTWLECSGSPFFQNAPFYPVVEMLQQGFGWSADLGVDAQLDSLARTFDRVGLDATEHVPLVASLLGLPLPVDRFPPPIGSPEHQRRRLFASLTSWVLASARLQPLVIVVEDLHWVDPSTLELQTLLIEPAASSPLLLVYTARPELQAPWPLRAHQTQVTLNRLAKRHVRDMVRSVAAQAALPADVLESVVARTDGVPLFVEELTKAVLESGTPSRATHAIPMTLQDSLMARLDRLGPAKEVAQIAAVIGREFSYPLLAAVADRPAAELQAAVARLCDAELVHERGAPASESYVFKHMLVQETAYDSLLKSRRRELHRAIATVLESQFPEVARSQPEIVAHHHTRAGDAAAALDAWERAAAAALQRWALGEAADHYTSAIGVLGTLPETPARGQREMVLQMALGHTLRGPKGYTSSETARAFARARELGERLGDAEQLVFVLVGIWQVAFNRSEVRATMEAADQLAAVADRHGGSVTRTWGRFAQGVATFYVGDLATAETHLAAARELYDEKAHHGMPSNPGVGILSFSALTAWLRGYPDRARTWGTESLALAGRLARPSSVAVAHMFAGALHILFRDVAGVLQLTDVLQRLATEYGFPMFTTWAMLHRGWALLEQGSHEQAVTHLRDAIAGQQAVGQRASQPFYLGILADAYERMGAVDRALGTLEDAIEGSEEDVWKPGLLCLRAQLFARQALDPAVVAATYREALTLARRQGNSACALIASIGLTRLLRTRDARNELGALYASFTEGFNTHELREAKALLEELDE